MTRCRLLSALTIVLLGLTAARAGAATFTVTKGEDTRDGVCNADCSLREAVDAANSSVGADTVVLPPGRYAMSRYNAAKDDTNDNGDFDIGGPLTISGAGADRTLIVNGGLDERLLDVRGAGTGLSISGVTLSGGHEVGGSGGAIRQESGGALTVERSVLRDNVATNAGAGYGGAIEFTLSGTLTIRDGALIGNAANWGGGLFVGGATATGSVENTTFAWNSATSHGGALYSGNPVPLRLSFVTVSGNAQYTAGTDAGFGGDATAMTLANSIVAANMAPGGVLANCDNAFRPLTGGGNITDGAGGCSTSGAGDLLADPKLGPVVFSQAIPGAVPLAGSPAIGHVPSGCPATDATGTPRPTPCSAGAIEPVVAAPPPPPQTITNTVTVEVPAKVTPSVVTPKITGSARVGGKLTCKTGRTTGATGTRIAWLRGSKTIRGATKTTYKLTRKDRRKVVGCRVSAIGPGGTAVAVSLGRYVK